MMEAVTTKAAVIAMRRASTTRKADSEEMAIVVILRGSLRSHLRMTERRLSRRARSHPFHRHRDLRAVADGLIDHAIALGEFQQQIELVLRRVGLDVEAHANFGKADRSFLV